MPNGRYHWPQNLQCNLAPKLQISPTAQKKGTLFKIQHMQLVQRIKIPLILQNLIELTAKSESHNSTCCSTLGWHSTYLGLKRRGTCRDAPNAIGRSKHLPLSQVQNDFLCLHFLKYNRSLQQDVVKGKAIPLQAWTGSEGSRRLRLPDFKTIGT